MIEISILSPPIMQHQQFSIKYSLTQLSFSLSFCPNSGSLIGVMANCANFVKAGCLSDVRQDVAVFFTHNTTTSQFTSMPITTQLELFIKVQRPLPSFFKVLSPLIYNLRFVESFSMTNTIKTGEP